MKKRTNKSALEKKIPTVLLNYCSADWHALIASKQKTVFIKAGERIFKQGEKVSGIHFIATGKVKVSILYNTKEERILRLAGDNQLIGHRGISNDKYPVSAVALTDCELIFFPNDVFFNLIRTNPDFSVYLINFLAEEIRDTQDCLVNLMQLEVKERLAYILVMLVDVFGFDKKNSKKLALTLSRKDFASFAATSYETVIRNLFVLQQEKLIRLEGKEMQVLNLSGLKKTFLKKIAN